MNKSEVSYIIFQNGDVEKFVHEKKSSTNIISSDSIIKLKKRSYTTLSVGLASFVSPLFTASIDYMNNSARLGIGFAFSTYLAGVIKFIGLQLPTIIMYTRGNIILGFLLSKKLNLRIK